MAAGELELVTTEGLELVAAGELVLWGGRGTGRLAEVRLAIALLMLLRGRSYMPSLCPLRRESSRPGAGFPSGAA